MALIDNLVSYWACDEASGSLLDAHSTNHLTDSNNSGTTTGKVNGARIVDRFGPGFSGTQYFYTASNSSLQTGDIDFTLAMWIYEGSDTAGDMRFISKYSGTASTSEYTTDYVSFNGTRTFSFFGGSSSSGVTVSWNAYKNTWAHVVWWHDSVNDEIGVAINAGTPTIEPHVIGVNSTSADFVVGYRTSGWIDEIGFWKRVLTSAERTELYNSGAGLAYPFSTPAAGIEQIRKSLPSSMQTILTR